MLAASPGNHNIITEKYPISIEKTQFQSIQNHVENNTNWQAED